MYSIAEVYHNSFNQFPVTGNLGLFSPQSFTIINGTHF